MQTRQHSISDRVIRWAFLWEEVKPLNTDSCSIFWRCVVLSPLKILAPTAAVLVMLFFVTVVPVVRALAPETAWLPALKPPIPQEEWAILWGIVGALVLVGVSAGLLHWAGFFAWLNRFCVPVTIGGGYVRKGSCPQCGNALILNEDNYWSCRKCRGYFVPPHVVLPAVPYIDPPTPS